PRRTLRSQRRLLCARGATRNDDRKHCEGHASDYCNYKFGSKNWLHLFAPNDQPFREMQGWIELVFTDRTTTACVARLEFRWKGQCCCQAFSLSSSFVQDPL